MDLLRSCTWGGHVRKVTLENGVKAWAFSLLQYAQAAVKNVESYLNKRDGGKAWSLPAKAETPLKSTYRPELDISAELNPTDASYYQSLIGVLRWIVELGRVDICLGFPLCRPTLPCHALDIWKHCSRSLRT